MFWFWAVLFVAFGLLVFFESLGGCSGVSGFVVFLSVSIFRYIMEIIHTKTGAFGRLFRCTKTPFYNIL